MIRCSIASVKKNSHFGNLKNSLHRLDYLQLEKRLALSAFVVTTTLDDASDTSNGFVSLREAVIAANTNASFGDAVAGSASGDTIVFDGTIFGSTLLLANGQLNITDDLMIRGVNSGIRIDGGDSSRIFNVNTTQRISFGGLTVVGGNAGQGGGIATAGGGTTVLYQMNFSQNVATGTGGGAVFNAGSNLYVKNCVMDGNIANGSSGSGGALYSSSGTVSIVGGQIKSNVANRAGGGIEIVDGRIYTTNVVVGGMANGDGNIAGPVGSASPGNGGGLHVSGTTGTRVAIRGGEFSGNIAAQEGGGLWNQGSSAFMVLRAGAVVKSNVAQGPAADNGGGGVFNNGGTLRILDATISDNTAVGTSGSGGGVFSTSGDVTILDSTLTANVAARAGGAIEIVDGRLFVRNAVVGGSAANGNIAGPNGSANPGNGGGIHVSGIAGTRVTIDGGMVTYNRAFSQGGGLWSSTASTLVLRNGVLINNNGLVNNISKGGGVYVRGHLQATDAFFANNFAGTNGGGIFVDAVGSANVINSTVTANDGGTFGGGIYNRGFAYIDSSVITNNTVAINGGGIFTELGATTTLVASDVSQNVPNDVNT